jgi:hypothetical protein
MIRRPYARRLTVAIAEAAGLLPLRFEAQERALPNHSDSVKFPAIGDNGTGDQPEYDVASWPTDQRRNEHRPCSCAEATYQHA